MLCPVLIISAHHDRTSISYLSTNYPFEHSYLYLISLEKTEEENLSNEEV